ncbi:hypothetical protein HDU67_007672 [Dinochytrium kinnereticum]|nr:hypothetical protein HDU67_007672 [Dinochytrium kinnereticum]
MDGRWFHALDAPKSDTTPFKVAVPPPADGTTKPPKLPTNWAPFSTKDSAAIEAIWQQLQKQKQKSSGDDRGGELEFNLGSSKIETRVAVNEDQLFEVDVLKKEIYPVYWYGPTYDIRRGTWFMSADGVKFMPCDDNLTRQLEDGFMKFKPWKGDQAQLSSVTTHISSTDPLPNSESTQQETPTSKDTPNSKAAEAKAAAISKPELRWALFGPWMNSFVIFTGSGGGWLFSDQLSSKWARAFMSGLTRGENQGGTRVARGWAEVEKLKKGTAAKQKRRSVPDKGSIPGADTLTPEKLTPEQIQERNEAEDYNNEGEENERQINHLVLVIHGIGQKLGERLETVNFVHDCAVLRHAIKDGARNVVLPATSKEALKPGNRKPVLPMPELGGVQVLPVQWRQKINFGRRKSDTVLDGDDDDRVDIDEISLEGVPSIRMLVSDVALDVLLYMTPKYRQEMVKHVTEELNRIYRTFMQRNPKFNGKVSIYGHSLGSLLAFDILCNQPFESDIIVPQGIPIPSAKPSPKPLRMKGMSEVDLSDMLRGALSSGAKDSRKVNGLLDPVEIRYEKLEFEVDKLFAVGSPVGLFLLLKGDRLRGRKPEPSLEVGFSRPAVNALYNIFHPHARLKISDPIAYRFEPLVAKSYSHKKPVQIQYNKGGLTRTIVGIADISSNIVDQGKSIFSGIFSTTSAVVSGAWFGGSGSAAGAAATTTDKSAPNSNKGSATDLTPAVLASSFQSMSVPSGPPPAPSILSATPPGPKGPLSVPTSDRPSVRNKTSGESIGQQSENGNSESGTAAPASVNSSSVSLVTTADDEEEVKRLNPSGRIDYVLQEGVLENAYLISLSSHMTYWPDQDIAVFILKELYSTGGIGSGGITGSVAGVALGSSPKK